MKTHKAKKSLGQNFLKSKVALESIVRAGEISPNDIVLEIGPGKGALTEKLLEKSNCVIAIEKDRNLYEFLQEKFSKEISQGKLILIESDILKFDFTEEIFSNSPRKFSGENFLCPSPSLLPKVHSRTFPHSFNYKIIANIPYNITGAILKKFLTTENQPERMVLMVQQEVAQRILARDGKESILSISVKAYGSPGRVMKVPARYFSPAPKVNSAVISIKNISRKFFEENNIREDKFWEIIHLGFAHKRKKLSGNLKKIFLSDKLTPLGPSDKLRDKRAENLTLSDWLLLTKRLDFVL
jgi:16S rRNA (adenine1518-N6/adenine1519-N6)-dimethyltransferase